MQRQAEGIAIAKAEGRYKGRMPISVDADEFERVYRQWKNGEITARSAMSKVNLKPNTFYRRVSQFEKQSNIAVAFGA